MATREAAAKEEARAAPSREHGASKKSIDRSRPGVCFRHSIGIWHSEEWLGPLDLYLQRMSSPRCPWTFSGNHFSVLQAREAEAARQAQEREAESRAAAERIDALPARATRAVLAETMEGGPRSVPDTLRCKDSVPKCSEHVQ